MDPEWRVWISVAASFGILLLDPCQALIYTDFCRRHFTLRNNFSIDLLIYFLMDSGIFIITMVVVDSLFSFEVALVDVVLSMHIELDPQT